MEYDIKPSRLELSKAMNIKILDSKELKFDDIDGIKVSELSALAYNKGKLYALSDRGYLYHFNISIKDNKIDTLKLKKAYRLKDKKGKKLKKSKRDSEGMVFVDGNLLISFERKPRVELFSLKAKELKNEKINRALKDIESYKSKNRALEAVAYNKKYGVVTAPELALKKKNKDFHTLYAKDKTWKFPASGSITALEFLENSEILVLERSFNNITRKRVAIISKVFLSDSTNNICKSKVLAILDSSNGWEIDNFEGLTRVSKNKFLMISDDNDSFLQKTLLVLFEIVDN